MANYKSLEQAKMYKLDPSVLNSILTPDVEQLRDIFTKYNYEIRIVGGAVRDLLLGEQPKNLNFATTATTKEMEEMFTKEQIPTVNSSEKYPPFQSIITVNISSSREFEISKITIGTSRHPTEMHWRLDAQERDLTINAIFLDFDGNIHDHFGGHEDLKKRKVRFVTDAESAIANNYSRILRYFRFHCQIAENPANHEGLILFTIMKYASNLRDVPGKLIWNELKIILQDKSRDVVIETMMTVGIGRHIGLGEVNLAEFQRVSRKNMDMSTQPIMLLAALCKKFKTAVRLLVSLDLSQDEQKLLMYITENRSEKLLNDDKLLPYLKRMHCGRLKLSKEYLVELLKYQGREELIDKLQEMPKFPIDQCMLEAIDNADITLRNKFAVEELVKFWYKSNYNLSADELLKLLPNILRKFEQRLKKRLSRNRNNFNNLNHINYVNQRYLY